MLTNFMFFMSNALAVSITKSDIVGVWGDVGTCNSKSGTYQLYSVDGDYKIVDYYNDKVTTQVDTNWWIVNGDRIVYGNDTAAVAGVLMISSITSSYMKGIMVYSDDSMQNVVFEKCPLQ